MLSDRIFQVRGLLHCCCWKILLFMISVLCKFVKKHVLWPQSCFDQVINYRIIVFLLVMCIKSVSNRYPPVQNRCVRSLIYYFYFLFWSFSEEVGKVYSYKSVINITKLLNETWNITFVYVVFCAGKPSKHNGNLNCIYERTAIIIINNPIIMMVTLTFP